MKFITNKLPFLQQSECLKRHFGEFLAGKYRVLIGNVLLCIRNQVLHGRYTVIPEIIGDFGEYSYSLCDVAQIVEEPELL